MTDYNIEFKDHRVVNPNRFKMVTVSPGVVDLVPIWIEDPSQIIEEGTPVNADLFEKLRANVTRRSETFAATAGQTIFNLTKAYIVDQGRLDVYISGVKQRSGIDFIETSPTSFTLSEGLEAGEIVEAVYFSASQALSEDLIEQVQAAEAATIAANDAADDANDAAAGALTANLTWKEPVDNLTALNALASPQKGDTRQTKDTGYVYRYTGTDWSHIQTMDPNAINALDTRLTSQLAEKVTKGQASVSDINKNLGLIDETYLTDGLKQQIAGTAPISTVPADYSLTLKKATYSKVVSANLFDKGAASPGRIDGTTGAYVADASYYSSEHIAVTPGTTLRFSANVSRYAFYDANKVYVSGATLGTAITQLVVPASVVFVRVTFYFTNLDTFMIAVGTLPATYEPFRMAIQGDYLTGITGSAILDGSITAPKTDFFEVGKNIALKEYAIAGKYVSSTDGTLKTNADYTVFHFVPVKQLTDYAYNFDGQVALYDANKTFVRGIFGGGVAGNKTMTTATGEVFASFSTKAPTTFQVEVGTSSTAFEEPGYYVKKSSLPPLLQTESQGVVINLPNTLYATVNEEFNVYFSNLLKEKKDAYNINVECSFGKQTADRFTGTPTTTGSKALTVEVYEQSKLVASKSVNVLVSNPRTTPLKVMLIGDSTVRADTNGDGVGEGLITQRLLDKLGANVQLVGTMGTAPNRWEGRGGWTAAQYRTGNSYEGVVNPFYNPATTDFDFSYYMSNQGFTGVDVVIIQLGINDTFSLTTDAALATRIAEVKANFTHIINSIKSYNPSVKVALNITIPPNDSQDMFGDAYGVGQTQWRYKYNNHIWVEEMIKAYQASVDLINVHTSIDTKNNIADGVHPKVAGYTQLGNTDYSYLNSLA